MFSKSKSLSFVICLWFPRFRGLPIFDQPILHRGLFQLFLVYLVTSIGLSEHSASFVHLQPQRNSVIYWSLLGHFLNPMILVLPCIIFFRSFTFISLESANGFFDDCCFARAAIYNLVQQNLVPEPQN